MNKKIKKTEEKKEDRLHIKDPFFGKLSFYLSKDKKEEKKSKTFWTFYNH